MFQVSIRMQGDEGTSLEEVACALDAIKARILANHAGGQSVISTVGFEFDVREVDETHAIAYLMPRKVDQEYPVVVQDHCVGKAADHDTACRIAAPIVASHGGGGRLLLVGPAQACRLLSNTDVWSRRLQLVVANSVDKASAQRLAVIHDGFEIVDPSRSACGRFSVDAATTYGMTPGDTQMLRSLNDAFERHGKIWLMGADCHSYA